MLEKTLIINDIVIEIIKRTLQSALLNILLNNVFPRVINLFSYLNASSYYLILLYMFIAVIILFVMYKIYSYFNSKKKQKSSSKIISSLSSNLSDFDLDPKIMKKKKNKKKFPTSSKSKKTLSTDLLSS
jgi:ABC-type multidrug transport system fused ATPase/permease subunit